MPKRTNRAYLDIETDWNQHPTVVGIYCEGRMTQLVGKEITKKNIQTALKGDPIIYTFWGHRFDLPRLKATLGLDIRENFETNDLADDCHFHNLYGGLKKVERKLGIPRKLKEVDGKDAMVLWHKYKSKGDEEALEKLLLYNEEDVKNLEILRKKLRVR